MSTFRIPVLETFIWQKEIDGFINNESDVNPIEGNRFIINNPDHLKYNNICSYTGKDWIYDIPKVGMTTIIKNENDFDIYCYSNNKWELYSSDKFIVLPSFLGNKIPEYDPLGQTETESSSKLWTISRLFQWLNENISTFTLGWPTDGKYDDGLFNWSNKMRIEDALDDVNTILKKLAPDKPQSLSDKNLTTNNKTYSGKISANIESNNWYSDSYQPGIEISNIINGENIILFSPLQDNCFSDADKGTLSIFYGQNTIPETEVAIYDLKNSFIPKYKNESQNLTEWDGRNPNCFCFSDGEPQKPIIIDNTTTLPFNNNTAKLIITDVSCYNNFYLWQKCNCQINFLKCNEGYNKIYLQHDLKNGTIEITNPFEFFYDTNNSEIQLYYLDDPFTITSDVVLKTLSGVKYYTSGTIINLKFDILNAITNVYSSNNLVTINLYNNIIIINASDIPNTLNDIPIANSPINICKDITLNSTSKQSKLNVEISVDHPFKEKTFDLNSDKTILYIPDTDLNTNLSEYFTSELYRIPQDSDFSTIISNGTWDSSKDLSLTNDAVIYYDQLQHSISNDISGYYPNNEIDYSNKVGKQYYIRKFYSETKTPFNSIVFDLNGINIDPIEYCVPVSQSGVGYSIEIKLPGVTEWLDAGLPFDKSTFNPNKNGCGCRDLSTTTNVKLGCTFGTINSSLSNYTIYVRITFNNSLVLFNSICTNWR